MTELMVKMTLWLLAAIALGFTFGWLLSRAVKKSKYIIEIESLSAAISDRNQMLEKLEQKFRNEKIMFEKISKDYKVLEEKLAEKSSLLSQLQAKFEKAKDLDFETLKKENLSLSKEIKRLKEIDRKREKELKEFETVLVKAEELIDENEKKYKGRIKDLESQVESLTLSNDEKAKTMELYQKTISEFENELKLYTATSEDDEFVISKDQFIKIEEQLEAYQKEIADLKRENSGLAQKSMEEVIENLPKDEKELDDGSIVKLFRETYKKITKS